MAVQTRRLTFDSVWLAWACIGLGLLMLTAVGLNRLRLPPADSQRPQIRNALAQLPLSFIENAGQTHPAVRFTVRGAGHIIFFTPEEVVFSASQEVDGEWVNSVVRLRLVGADPDSRIESLEKLPGAANYLVGDRSRWRTGVPTYGAVAYREVYEEIDLVYRGTEGRLKSEFRVAPGADPGQIRLAYSGVESLRLGPDGTLVLTTPLGELIEEAPLVYQDVDGARHTIQGRYVLLDPHGKPIRNPQSEIRNPMVGFALGEYDSAFPLVIDPTLSYSTYLGGSKTDQGLAIAVDGSGNAYVTGRTASSNFPEAGTYGDGSFDAFVTKLNATGSSLAYSTYLGGSGSDEGYGIAVDASGDAYVTGITSSSTDFPTANAYQSGFGGGSFDAFVTKLGGAGSVVYSTYLGGSRSDEGHGMAVDANGNAFVTGKTESTDFPRQSAYDNTLDGGTDAFVTQLNAAGSGLSYSTYLGGDSSDTGRDITVDGSGNAYVTGDTSSSDFPTTPNAHDDALGGSQDAFVTQFSAGGTLTYSTYLGGSGDESGRGIAVDGDGNAYVTGWTGSIDFPTASAYQGTCAGGCVNLDAFVTKLNAAGSAPVYSTYLGGGNHEEGHDIAVNANGNAFVTGQTNSGDFPTANPYDNFLGGSQDAFVTTLNAAGSGLTYSTYLGGSGTTFEQGLGIAVDGSGNAYVGGFTDSNDFPTANAYQIGFGGGSYDAFVTKIPFGPTAVRLSSFTARSAERGASLASALAVLGVGLVALGVGVLVRRRWLVHVIPSLSDTA